MKHLLFSFPGNRYLEESLLQRPMLEKGEFEFRHFPDGETYLRLRSDVKGRDVVILQSLNQPDPKVLSLYFFSTLLREHDARSVILLAPYLAYMRQDKIFNPGETITSKLFAALVGKWFDGLVTVDPHLHRYNSLSQIYSIPSNVLHAEPFIAEYISSHIKQPVIIGPDAESEQWVSRIAKQAGADYVVLQKERLGDREVRVTMPHRDKFIHHTPVLVDDIISTGRTMLETIGHLKDLGTKPPVCLAVHGVFAEGAYDGLLRAGVQAVVTSNTIEHSTNGIDISPLIVEGLKSQPEKWVPY